MPYVPPCPDNCLIVTSPITACEDSAPPCGGMGVLDLGVLNDLTVCEGCTPTYTLLSYDSTVFVGMALDANTGELTWTTGGANVAIPGNFYEVRYKVECACLNLASQGIVTICIRDLCGTQICPDGEECDPCTGNCVPIVDIEVE